MAVLIVRNQVKDRLWDRIERDRREGYLPSSRDTPDEWKGDPVGFLIVKLLDATEFPEPPLPIEVEERD